MCKSLSLLLFVTLCVAACSETTVCTTEARAGIRAVVRDAMTGAALGASAVGLAREGAFVDTLFGFDSLMFGAYERPGTYRLEVSLSGYQNWSRDGVRVSQVGECGHVETVRVPVLLVPQ